MWHEVLTRLPEYCRVQPMKGTGRAGWRRPDGWLFDGHGGPLAVVEPQIIQLHEMPWGEPETMATLEPDFLEQVVEPSRRAALVAAAIVCPSASAQRQIVQDCGVAAARVHVAHHGVDHSVFHPGVDGGDAIAERHGADPARPFVLSVASIHPRKNLLALRDAMHLLHGEGLPHQLLIVEGPSHGRTDGDALRADLFSGQGTERVVSVAHGIDDHEMAALMGAAAAFCLPSLTEGFGLPAAEAMACGAPAVLSTRGALPEVGGEAAVMVEPDPAAIAAGLRSVLVDPAAGRAVGSACAEQAARFTWDRCAADWATAIAAGPDGRP